MPAAIGARASESVETSREATQNTVNTLQQQLTSARAAGATRVYVAPQLKANSELYTKLQELKANLQKIRSTAGRRSIHSISAAPDPL